MTRSWVCLAVCLVAYGTTDAAAQRSTLIRSVSVINVVDGSVSPESAVLIENGYIVQIGPSAEVDTPPNSLVIDGGGRWLIPGIIEVHTHTTGRNALRRALALGVTSALVIHSGSAPSQALEVESREIEVPMPRVYLVGGRFSAEFPGDLIPGAARFQAPQSASEARSAVAALAQEGFRAIKIWQDDAAVWVGDTRMPTFSTPVTRALINAAHDHGMKAYVHAWDPALFRAALPLGPDGFVHPILSSMTADDVEQLAEWGLPWVSTFSLLLEYGNPVEFARRVTADARLQRGLTAEGLEEYRQSLGGDPEQYREIFPALVERVDDYVRMVAANARRVHKAGLTIAVGSDATAGYGTHLEIEMLAAAGLDPLTILRAATLGGAEFLDEQDSLGSIEVGKIADLVVLDENPLSDPKNLRSAFLVLKGGVPFDPDIIGSR